MAGGTSSLWPTRVSETMGDYRDIEISQMSFQANRITYEYQQSFAEENLWLARRKDAGDGDRVEGLALV